MSVSDQEVLARNASAYNITTTLFVGSLLASLPFYYPVSYTHLTLPTNNAVVMRYANALRFRTSSSLIDIVVSTLRTKL